MAFPASIVIASTAIGSSGGNSYSELPLFNDRIAVSMFLDKHPSELASEVQKLKLAPSRNDLL